MKLLRFGEAASTDPIEVDACSKILCIQSYRIRPRRLNAVYQSLNSLPRISNNLNVTCK